jgi:hypothetical protein
MGHKRQRKYNFLINRENVLNYWQSAERLRGAENIFTIGMRGKHDGKMEGVKTWKIQKSLRSYSAKQEMLRKYIVRARKVPQIFVPYKESRSLCCRSGGARLRYAGVV